LQAGHYDKLVVDIFMIRRTCLHLLRRDCGKHINIMYNYIFIYIIINKSFESKFGLLIEM
jgi:hypothetical protein